MIRKYDAVLAIALVVTACSEGPTAPVADGGDVAFIALHGSIAEPELSPSVDGSAVTIAWTWSDSEDAWDLVSFKVTRDGVDLGLGIPNAKPYTAGVTLNRSITDYGLLEGTYEYCVEVMAKWAPNRQTPTTTHHSKSCETVEVGEAPEYSISMLGGNIADATQNRNANTWTIGYELFLGDEQVMDCDIKPGVELAPTAVVKQHNCDLLTGARNLVIENPAKGDVGSYSLVFSMGGNPIHTFNFVAE